MINGYKTRREWKIQLTMRINFICFKDSKEACTMYTKSRNIEIIMGNEADDIIEELRKSRLQNGKKDLKEPMRGNDFAPDSIDLLYYHLQKISSKRGRSYTNSPEWLKNKKSNNNNDDNCLQYALTVALNHQSIEKSTQRISTIKPFIDQYNWKGIDFSLHSKDWKKFEQNNKIIALNILFVPHNTKKIRLAYKSKHTFKCENQVILLMITNVKNGIIFL